MYKTKSLRIAFGVLLILIYPLRSLLAQNFPVPGGTVYPGVQTCFPFTVSGLPPGITLGDPGSGPWPVASIDSFCINIQTSHPWTLEVTLVSPNGTILTLSSFNGAGGTNYTNTCFTPTSVTPIVGTPAPFSGDFQPQQTPPGFSIFDGESPNGVWQMCILDTLTDSTSLSPGPPGVGATSTASGTMGIGTTACAPCSTLTGISLPPMSYFDVCPYDYIDFVTPYITLNPGLTGMIWEGWAMGGIQTNTTDLLLYGTSYFVMVYDQCSGTCIMGASIDLFPLPDYPINGNQVIDQCQNTTIDLNTLMSVNGANPDWTYNSSPITTAAASVATLPGTYQVNVPPVMGLYCAVSGVVDINTLPSPDIGPDQTINGCTVAPVDLTTLYVTTGMIANWYLNGNLVSNPSAVVGNGNYILVVDSANGCKDTAIVTLNQTPTPLLGPDQSVDFCGTSTVNLSTLYNTVGYTANWTLNGVAVSNPAAVNTAGSYSLIANNSNGCADTAIVTLNMLSTPALGPDQTIIGCTVAAYDLTALFNTTGLTTNWYRNGNPVANPAAVIINGNYMLVATNASGCSDTAMVSLNMSIGPALGADQSVNACSGSTINLTSLYATGSFTVSWTSGGVAVPNPASVGIAGIYTLIASNTNGCADTAVVTVTISLPPVLGIDQVHDICSNTFLDLTSLYNTTGLTSSWTINGIAVPVPTAVSAAGIYTIVATDLNNCSDQAAVTINSLAAPGLGPDQNTAFCPGGTADLTTLYSTGGFITSWTLSGVPVANQSGINVPGTYQLIATSTNGCSDTAITIVIAATFPVLGADQQLTACDNQPVNLTAVYNTSGYTSIWSSNGVPVSDPTIVNTAGTYQIVSTNASGCSATANVNLSINPAPVLGNDQSLSICSGTIIDLTALYSLTGLTPQWSVNGTPFPDPINAGTAGIYQLVAANSNNCFDTAIVVLSITTGPSLGTDQSFELCPWMTLNFNSLYDVTGLNATWSLNGQSIQNYTAVYDSGMYQVSVTDVNGCTDEATVVVENIYCECNVDFTYEGKCMKDPVTFIVMADSAITGVHWSFSNPLIPESYALEPIVSFPSSDIVLVTLEAVLSCGTRVVEKNVKMEDCADSCRVYIPSAFTPNNDSKNEGFKSVTECTPLAYEMEIWNSFGQSVFKSEDYGHAWDGKNYPEGVYIYQVNYQMPYQIKKTVTGRVTVLR